LRTVCRFRPKTLAYRLKSGSVEKTVQSRDLATANQHVGHRDSQAMTPALIASSGRILIVKGIDPFVRKGPQDFFKFFKPGRILYSGSNSWRINPITLARPSWISSANSLAIVFSSRFKFREERRRAKDHTEVSIWTFTNASSPAYAYSCSACQIQSCQTGESAWPVCAGGYTHPRRH